MKRNNNKGMTLVEILIAMSIGLVVSAATLVVLLQVLKMYQYETGKLLVNRDIRRFTTQMVDDATYANYFLIFDQRSNLSRSGYTLASGGSANPVSSTYYGYTADLALTEPDDPVTTTGPGTANVQSGLTGDVVVFVYHVNGDNTKINQLIIYYRPIATPAGGTTGTNSATASARTTALKRVVVNITDATAQSRSIWKLLPDLANVPATASAKNLDVFSYVDGQAGDAATSTNRINKMFYNLNNTSVLVRGRIYENYTAQRLVKSTYNFTVTPRG
jgi:prepilin-type N-terminal cleavage/methylation domain-containing protein